MRSRAPIALLLALACVLLASCRTNVGVAAHVNGSTITESQVGKYISSSGVDTAYAAQLQQQGASAAPSRTVVLQLLIQDQLFDRALATNGGVPSQGVLAALSQRSRTLLSGGGPAPTDAQLRTELAKAGITASFLPQFLDAIEKEYLLVQRLGLTQQSQLDRGGEEGRGRRHGQPPLRHLEARSAGDRRRQGAGRAGLRQPRHLTFRMSGDRGTADEPGDAEGAARAAAALGRAAEVMDRLRSPGGCPWDAEQTHESLTRYLLEECYEVLEAIETEDRALLREELGDLLLQVLFHARIAQEGAPEDAFGIAEVADDLVAKLIRRHPHVFAPDAAERDRSAAALNETWERQKIAEKQRTSAVDGVPRGAAGAGARRQARLSRAPRRPDRSRRGSTLPATAPTPPTGSPSSCSRWCGRPRRRGSTPKLPCVAGSGGTARPCGRPRRPADRRGEGTGAGPNSRVPAGSTGGTSGRDHHHGNPT